MPFLRLLLDNGTVFCCALFEGLSDLTKGSAGHHEQGAKGQKDPLHAYVLPWCAKGIQALASNEVLPLALSDFN